MLPAMSRTPADVPDLPSELTEDERVEVARLAARDAGGVFINPEQVELLRGYVARVEGATGATERGALRDVFAAVVHLVRSP